MARRNYKITTVTSTLTDALSAYQGVEDLREQMTEWRENMDNAEMSHMPKYEEVEACCEVLDRYDDLQQECDELAEMLEGTSLDATPVSSQEMTPYKGRGYPRWMQMSNSLGPVQAACARVTQEENGIHQEALADAIEKAAEIEGICEELEGAEFPGMF